MTSIEAEDKQGFRMDFLTFKEMWPMLLVGATTLGGAIAWVINRGDRKNSEEREFEVKERAKLEKLFSDQIASLQAEIHSQSNEIIQLRYELTVYVRHVGILEGLLKAKGVEPPPLALERPSFLKV